MATQQLTLWTLLQDTLACWRLCRANMKHRSSLEEATRQCFILEGAVEIGHIHSLPFELPP